MTATIELTDLFCGQANYSWCKREVFDTEGMTERQIIREARKLIDITGAKTIKSDYGDSIRWDFAGRSIVAFLQFNC